LDRAIDKSPIAQLRGIACRPKSRRAGDPSISVQEMGAVLDHRRRTVLRGVNFFVPVLMVTPFISHD
jgi:hypothetical protein